MRKQAKDRQLGLLAIVSTLSLLLLICSVLIVDNFMYPSITEPQHERKTLWFDGVSYFPRQDIQVFLLMGIDREGPVVASGSYKNSGAADVVLVLIFDDTAKEYRVLALNRDSMVNMPVLGIGGKFAGNTTAQLALSHTYGDGLHESSENTRDTVSNMLYGVQIDQYISMNMDVISVLTDAVGGVKVTVRDDFSSIDSTITKGEMVLNGDQAYKFVRTRKDMGDQLNISRMDRHEEFMKGFVEAFRTNLGRDINRTMEVYDSVSQYIVTDCSDHILSDLLNRFYDYDFVDVLSAPGINVRGEEYMEFYIDEEKLCELILPLMYSPKSK